MNEALFRETNNRVEDRLRETHRSEYMTITCECAKLDCAERIAITTGDYRTVRDDSAQFVVVHGHEIPDIEEVILDTASYRVVRKLGLGKVVATALDDPESRSSE